MQDQELIDLTEKLLGCNEEIMQKFEETKQTEIAGDFYREVKPFVDRVKEIMDQWEEKVIAWITNCRPRNLHVNQIESVKEQLEMIAVQAFFPQTSRTRFLNTVHSVDYVLKTILLEIEKDI